LACLRKVAAVTTLGKVEQHFEIETALMATSPFKFLQQVREETRKVTWPSRRETAITTAMVFVMVAIASVFFLVADQLIRIAVTFVLGITI